MFDQTSFSKFLLQGRDAARVLNRLCAGEVDVAVGRSVYTGMLNDRGGYESDLTALRLARKRPLPDRHRLGADHPRRRLDPPQHPRRRPRGAHRRHERLRGDRGDGPRLARPALPPHRSPTSATEAFPFASHQTIDLGYATVTANRMTYVGELGWELFVPTEFAAGVYDDLISAGADLGVTDAGYLRAGVAAPRKGLPRLGPRADPRRQPLRGRPRLRRRPRQTDGLHRPNRPPQLQKDRHPQPPHPPVHPRRPRPRPLGGELILRDGRPVGDLRSAAYGYTLAAATGLGWIRDETNIDAEYIANATWQIDIAGTLTPATAHLRTPYDPKSERVRA